MVCDLKAGFCLKGAGQGADIIVILLDHRGEFVTLGDAHAQTFDGNINDLVAVIKYPHSPNNVYRRAVRADELRIDKGVLVLLGLITDDKLFAVEFLELICVVERQIVLKQYRKFLDFRLGNRTPITPENEARNDIHCKIAVHQGHKLFAADVISKVLICQFIHGLFSHVLNDICCTGFNSDFGNGV